jgi:hypothetical protein
MNVSLDQAIEIHAKALKHKAGDRAPVMAREKARHCALAGDHGRHVVWSRVAATAYTLLNVEGASGKPANEG